MQMPTNTRSLTGFARMLAAVTILVLLVVSAAPAGQQDFTLHNDTGIEIYSVYVAPHDSDDWEEDILGQDTLADGDKVRIRFSRKEKAAKWDLRIEDEKGRSIEWENLNLLEISDVTLHYKKGKIWAEVE